MPEDFGSMTVKLQRFLRVVFFFFNILYSSSFIRSTSVCEAPPGAWHHRYVPERSDEQKTWFLSSGRS